MYKLSGNLQQNAVICVYKTSDGTLLKRQSLSAGDYELKYLESNNVFAVAVKSDGQGVVYGNVNLVRRGTELIADTFPGTSLDTNKWTATTNPAGAVTVNNGLFLVTQPGGNHCGAGVVCNQTLNKTGVIEVTCQWQPRNEIPVDNHPVGAVMFVNHSSTARDATYGHRSTNYVYLDFRAYSATQRRLAIFSSYSGTWIADNVGGIQFSNTLRSLLVRLNCSTRQMYVNLDNGFRAGTVTIPVGDFDALGSVMDLELFSSDYPDGDGLTGYETIKNFSIWTES